jgi:integrase
MLTDMKCKNIKPSGKPVKISDSGGLYLEVTPKGSKYWRLKYRFGGKEKKLAIGVYPTISLQDAREKRDDAKKKLANGIDPSAAKQALKRQLVLKTENTFERVAKEWFEHQKDVWSENHRGTVWRRLENEIFPCLGRCPLEDINPPQILELIRKIEARGANEVARRVQQLCGQVFRFAVMTGRLTGDPTSSLKRILKPYQKGHYAALDSKDLPQFLNSLYKNEARLFPLTKMAVELLMLTFVRTSELIKAKWEEIDLEEAVWVIPAERMKMRRDHIVPLSKQSVGLLKEISMFSGRSRYVFPARTGLGKHMSNNTILVALGRMGYKGKTTGHGFRALAMSTIKEKLNYRHEVIDRQLAHAHRNSVDAAYDRAQFLDERKKMMQEWADYLSVLAKDNVIQGSFGKVI